MNNQDDSASSGTGGNKVPLFDGTLFPRYKTAFAVWLEGKGWEGALSGPVPVVADNDAADIKTSKEKKIVIYRQVKSAIWSSLAGKVQDEMAASLNGACAYVLWTALSDKYAGTSAAHKAELWNQLATDKMKKSETFSAYRARKENIMTQLHNSGNSLSDEVKSTWLTRGLPEEWATFVESLEGVGYDKMSWSEVCRRLEAREYKLQVKTEEMAAIAAAATAAAAEHEAHMAGGYRSGNNRFGGGRGGFNNRGGGAGEHMQDTCWQCNKPGHRKNDCPDNAGKPKCEYCHKIGHRADVCRSRLRATGGSSSAYAPKPQIEQKRDDHSLFAAFNVFTGPTSADSVVFILDSGASCHFVNDKQLLSDIKTVNQPTAVKTANGVETLTESGTCKIEGVKFEGAMFAPNFAFNLISAGVMIERGAKVELNSGEATVSVKGRICLRFPKKGSLYILEVPKSRMKQQAYAASDITKHESYKSALITPQTLWHRRLGHLAPTELKKLVESNAVDGLDVKVTVDTKCICEPCVLGKSHRKAFNSHMQEPAKAIMDRAHADLAGPIYLNSDKEVESFGGYRYLLAIIDEYARRIAAIALKNKSDACDQIIQWHKHAVVFTGKPLKEFHSDGGGEFISKKLENYFKDTGTRMTTTTRATPQHNPIAERIMRTLFEMVRSMLSQATLSGHLWPMGVLTSAYLRNRCLTSGTVERLTPEEIWSGHKPSVKHIKVFGCDAYVNVLKDQRLKLDPKAVKGMFIGYDTSKSGAYRVLEVDTKKIWTSHEVTFEEEKFTEANKLYRQRDGEEGPFRFTEDLEAEKHMHMQQGQGHAPGQVQQAEEHMQRAHEPLQEAEQEQEHMQHAQEDAQRVPVPAQQHVHMQQESKHNSDHNDGHMHIKEENDEDDSDSDEEPPERKEQQRPSVSAPPAAAAPQPTRASTRHSAPPNRLGMVDERDLERPKSKDVAQVATVLLALMATSDPKTYKQAMSRADAPGWQAAMDKEMESHMVNGTWELVVPPDGANIVDCMWVYKTKLDSAGEIERLKARAVAKGYTMQYGTDYTETFAPTLRRASLRVLLAIAAINDMEIGHMDVDTAFLNAPIKETVYMRQPPGFEVGDGLVCLLKKTIYGTKQAPNAWNNELNTFLISIGLIPCKSDTCVYVKKSASGGTIMLGVFVDDLIPVYARKDISEWNDLKAQMMRKYKMKDSGDCAWVLGMTITRDRAARTIKIGHESYVKKMLEKYHMDQCKASKTPAETAPSYSKESTTIEEESVTDIKVIEEYRAMVGALLYTSTAVRPDIAYAVGLLTRHMQQPRPSDIQAAKRTLRYLQGTSNLGLDFNGLVSSGRTCTTAHMTINGYCDADWAGDANDGKSTTGYIIKLNNCVVSWCSTKQKSVALSTAEAEYMAISAAVQEIIWLQQLLSEINMGPSGGPATLRTDSQSAKAISTNDAYHARTKHINIRHHFVRDQVKDGRVTLKWISGEQQIADMLTKALKFVRFRELRGAIMQ